jgi:riboflavin synthase
MFTGIVEERGAVSALADHRLVVSCTSVVDGSAIGSSIAVNGTCLTVVDVSPDSLAFDLSDETLARTSLRRLHEGDAVNLERPATLSSRLGGHLVQGHVDGVGEIAEFIAGPDDDGALVRVRLPNELLRYAVEKGSITVDGISLTIAVLHSDGVTIAVIPYTLAVTTLGTARAGDPVNIEVDVIAKYVERLLEGSAS